MQTLNGRCTAGRRMARRTPTKALQRHHVAFLRVDCWHKNTHRMTRSLSNYRAMDIDTKQSFWRRVYLASSYCNVWLCITLDCVPGVCTSRDSTLKRRRNESKGRILEAEVGPPSDFQNAHGQVKRDMEETVVNLLMGISNPTMLRRRWLCTSGQSNRLCGNSEPPFVPTISTSSSSSSSSSSWVPPPAAAAPFPDLLRLAGRAISSMLSVGFDVTCVCSGGWDGSEQGGRDEARN